MFHLTLKQNISLLFEGFCIIADNNSKNVIYSFPKGFDLKGYYQFLFPCSCKRDRTEEFTIVNSDGANNRSFIVCRYLFGYHLYLCINSYNPFFEIFSHILLKISQLPLKEPSFPQIDAFLRPLQILNEESYVLIPTLNSSQKPVELLKPSLTNPHIYDFYIKEYLTCVGGKSDISKKLWLEVYWSMLLERSIIFMSKRYQKLTASLLAATFFIHPLSWSQKFISIVPEKIPQLLGMNCCILGVHSCMEEIFPKVDFWDETLLVDLDKGCSKMVGNTQNIIETQLRFEVSKCVKKFYVKQMALIDENVTNVKPEVIENLVSAVKHRHHEDAEMYTKYQSNFHLYPLLFRTITTLIIGRYRDHFKFVDMNKIEFNKTEFINHIPKLSYFLKLLVNSQCFANFIDEKLYHPQESQDRFDRERLELNISDIHDKFFGKHKRFTRTKNVLSRSNRTSPVKFKEGVLCKTSTMPNLKRKKSGKVSNKDIVHAANQTNYNLNFKPRTRELSLNDESFSETILKSLKDKRIIPQDATLDTEMRLPWSKNSMLRESKSENCLMRDMDFGQDSNKQSHNQTEQNNFSGAVKKEEFIPGIVKNRILKYKQLSTDASSDTDSSKSASFSRVTNEVPTQNYVSLAIAKLKPQD